ncbi:MAG: HD-GYP domain-containing protein [Burkholderiales bacterium]|nr:HD-GYP domain-containing protein [Burkholderiales bacterium]
MHAHKPLTADALQARNHAPVCRHCGIAISAAPFEREDDQFCCEACFLKQREQHDLADLAGERDRAYLALAEALAAALDAREHETGLHSQRVACHTQVLARRFTQDPQRLRQIYWGALLHDLGKVGIPDAILQKQGPLTQDEWLVMRTHPEIGQRILASVPFMAEAAEIVLCHEERFDGSGYPRGLSGEAIPLAARLFALIDTLDAMTSDRPYRKGLSFDAAKTEILRMSGTQFDPQAVEAFSVEEKILREMVAMKCGMAPIAMEAG